MSASAIQSTGARLIHSTSYDSPLLSTLPLLILKPQTYSVITIYFTTESLGTYYTTDSTVVTKYQTDILTMATTIVSSNAATVTDYVTSESVTTITEAPVTVYPDGTGTPSYSILPPDATSKPPVPLVPRVRRVVHDVVGRGISPERA